MLLIFMIFVPKFLRLLGFDYIFILCFQYLVIFIMLAKVGDIRLKKKSIVGNNREESIFSTEGANECNKPEQLSSN